MERKGKIIRKIVMIAIAAMVVLAVSLTALGVFQIRDTGIGIRDEDREKLLQTAKRFARDYLEKLGEGGE